MSAPATTTVTARAAANADSVVFLADGRIVDHLDHPTAPSVLDRISSLGG